jgi:hypothetical protein
MATKICRQGSLPSASANGFQPRMKARRSWLIVSE